MGERLMYVINTPRRLEAKAKMDALQEAMNVMDMRGRHASVLELARLHSRHMGDWIEHGGKP